MSSCFAAVYSRFKAFSVNAWGDVRLVGRNVAVNADKKDI